MKVRTSVLRGFALLALCSLALTADRHEAHGLAPGMGPQIASWLITNDHDPFHFADVPYENAVNKVPHTTAPLPAESPQIATSMSDVEMINALLALADGDVAYISDVPMTLETDFTLNPQLLARHDPGPNLAITANRNLVNYYGTIDNAQTHILNGGGEPGASTSLERVALPTASSRANTSGSGLAAMRPAW